MTTRVVHCKRERHDVYIGRPGPWGNPFEIGRDGDRAAVLVKYRDYLRSHPELVDKARRELKGKTLGCWCHPQPCHGDVLVAFIEGPLRDCAPLPAKCSKLYWPSMELAMAAADAIASDMRRQKQRSYIRPYRCDECGLYHVTSSPLHEYIKQQHAHR